MRIKILLLALMAFFACGVPVFASGNLTVSAASLAPAYINTNSSTPLLNLTLNATVGTVSLTSINVTVVGAVGDVSLIEVKNSTGSSIASSATVNSTTNVSTINITGFNVTTAQNDSLLINVVMNLNATLRASISLNVSSISFAADSGSNVSLVNNSVQSSSSQIQDVHVSGYVSPLFVDTNVLNQTFLYTLLPTGRDVFNNVSFTIPTQYAIVNVTEVKHGTNFLRNSSYSDPALVVGFNVSTGKIDVNYSTGFSQAVTVNISVNTSGSAVAATTFNSSLGGSNLSSLLPDVSGTNTTVSTLHIINVTNIRISKSAALANGTDYWEFNYSLAFNANISGLVQFKMSNWLNDAAQTMLLQNDTSGNISYYATLRDSTNSSRYTNVTNDYTSQGVAIQNCCNSAQTYALTLRMIIPVGTPSSQSWSSVYSMLFRST